MKKPIQLSEHFTFGKLLKFSFPSIAMMVFTSIYGIVDGFFVSNYAGRTAFAALNFIMPFIMMIGGLGFMVGTGGSALIAKTLGKQDDERADRYFSMMIEFVMLIGAVFSILAELFLPQVAVWMGADEQMLPDCVLYGRILLLGQIAFMLQNQFQSFFAVAERALTGFWFVVAAGVTNMILDFLFVGLWGWGLAGAAWATVASMFVGGVFPFFYFVAKNPTKFRFRLVALEWKPIFRACSNGFSELLSNISMSLVGMLYNGILMQMAGESGVAAYGFIMYVQFVFASIFIGYAIGTTPIVGYNYGADNKEELRSVLLRSVIILAVFSVSMFVLAITLAQPLAQLFMGYDEELCEFSRHGFVLFSFSFLIFGFNIYGSSFFTALNNGLVSAIISFFRTVVFQVAALLLLPLWLGIDGIWHSITVAELASLLLIVAFLIANHRRYGYFGTTKPQTPNT